MDRKASLVEKIMLSDKTDSSRRIYYLEQGFKPAEFLEKNSVETSQGLLVICNHVIPGFYKEDYHPKKSAVPDIAAIIVSTVPPAEQFTTDGILLSRGYTPPFYYWKLLGKDFFEL